MTATKNNNLPVRLKIALFGLVSAFKEERNFRLQCLIAIIVIGLIIIFGLNAIETSILLLTILVVLSLELINSQIEKFLDILHPDHHPRVKIIKDFSAGAVLLSALGSIVIGLLIFMPHLIHVL
jgi:undecaprenol kinase